MSVKLTDEIIALGLSPSEMIVLAEVIQMTDFYGECKLGRVHFVKTMSMSTRSVSTIFASLRKKGFIAGSERKYTGSVVPNIYESEISSDCESAAKVPESAIKAHESAKKPSRVKKENLKTESKSKPLEASPLAAPEENLKPEPIRQTQLPAEKSVPRRKPHPLTHSASDFPAKDGRWIKGHDQLPGFCYDALRKWEKTWPAAKGDPKNAARLNDALATVHPSIWRWEVRLIAASLEEYYGSDRVQRSLKECRSEFVPALFTILKEFGWNSLKTDDGLPTPEFIADEISRDWIMAIREDAERTALRDSLPASLETSPPAQVVDLFAAPSA